jgi:tRNA(fMet)-specific endonuclease VapC
MAAKPRYLIDTNIWSHLVRRSNATLVQRFAKLHSDQVCLSVVVRGELEVGFLKGDQSPQRRQALDHIVATCQALEIDQDVAVLYASVRTHLEAAGTPIGRNDTWIAAEALHHKLVLVTDNLAEFQRVPALKVESWL